MECNYVDITPTTSPLEIPGLLKENDYLLTQICVPFKGYGCCAANDVSMYQQAQTNASDVAIFPPCLLSYLTNICGLDMTDYCMNGSIASVATVVATTTITKTINGLNQMFLFPDMYNKTSINQLQGAISGIMEGFFPPGAVQPFIFNAYYPFQVQILSYVYMYLNGTTITTIGEPYYPFGGDYEKGEMVKVVYQVTVQSTESELQAATYLNHTLSSDEFGQILSIVYNGYVPVDTPVALVQPTIWFAPKPLELNAGYSVVNRQSAVVLCLLLSSATTLLLGVFV